FGATVVEELQGRSGGVRERGAKGMNRMDEADGLAFGARALRKAMPAAPGLAGAANGAPMEQAAAKKDAAFAGDEKAKGEKQAGGGKREAGKPGIEPAIRKNFADTALWAGSLTTDKEGMAEVSLNMPENLTAWKVKVWAMGHGTKVGQGEAEVTTKKDLLV